MRSYVLVSLVPIFVAACAAPEPGPISTAVANGSEGATSPPPRHRCAEAVTGSRIPQCNRQDVRVMSRDDLERRQTLDRNPALGGKEALGGQ
jgi:hypothetical protein